MRRPFLFPLPPPADRQLLAPRRHATNRTPSAIFLASCPRYLQSHLPPQLLSRLRLPPQIPNPPRPRSPPPPPPPPPPTRPPRHSPSTSTRRAAPPHSTPAGQPPPPPPPVLPPPPPPTPRPDAPGPAPARPCAQTPPLARMLYAARIICSILLGSSKKFL